MAFKISPAVRLVTKDMVDRESGWMLHLLDGVKSARVVNKLTVADSIGIYVFALRRPGGAGSTQPWYIGKTESNTLGRESLTKDKLRKYASAFFESAGTPVLYFLTPNGTKDRNRIDELETFLIWLARQKNPQLLNKKKVRLSPEKLQFHLENLEVGGFLNSRQGHPGLAAVNFRAMIGWKHVMHISSDI